MGLDGVGYLSFKVWIQCVCAGKLPSLVVKVKAFGSKECLLSLRIMQDKFLVLHIMHVYA